MEARSKKQFSTAQLLSLVARAEKALEKVELLPEENSNSAEFTVTAPLSKLCLPSGIKPRNIDLVIATFEPKGNPNEDLKRIVSSGQNAFKKVDLFSVMYVFKPPQFKEAKRPDECGIMFWKGKLLIAYECRAATDSVRATHFKNIISHSGLPLRVLEDGKGFSLSHDQDGLLLRQLSLDITGRNPMGFWCELGGANLNTASRIAQNATANSPVSAVKWTVVANEEKQLTLQEIVDTDFHCDEFEINFMYELDDLDVIEQLRKVKIKSGYFSTDILKFELNGEEAGLEIRTNPKGHILYTELSEESLPEVNRKLRVKLVPDE